MKTILRHTLVVAGILLAPQATVGIFFAWAVNYLPDEAHSLREMHVIVSGVIVFVSVVAVFAYADAAYQNSARGRE